MQRPDIRESLIVDLNQVFTLRSVLKDLSIVHDVAGRVSAMRIAQQGTEWSASPARSYPASCHPVAYAS